MSASRLSAEDLAKHYKGEADHLRSTNSQLRRDLDVVPWFMFWFGAALSALLTAAVAWSVYFHVTYQSLAYQLGALANP